MRISLPPLPPSQPDDFALFSSNLSAPQKAGNAATATALIFKATGEVPPYRLVGWGGGAMNVYAYALHRPEDVDSLVFLDVCE